MKALSKWSFKKSSLLETVEYYCWILPALLLVLVFLIIPTFHTIYLSLNEKVVFSENKYTQAILMEIKTKTGAVLSRYDQLKHAPGWEEAVQAVSARDGIEILISDLSEDMTIKDAAQMLVMTALKTVRTQGRNQKFVGLKNYAAMLKDKAMLSAFKNNLIWLVVFTAITVIIGLLIASLADRAKWSTTAKTIIFLPMAISGVASGVIWNFMYFKDVKTGTVNALLNLLPIPGFEGIAFLGRPDLVNSALIAAGVWMQVGFCTVIFSAALKAVPVELIEMARIEGATNLQIFRKIEIPIILPTVVVVVTQMIIWVLKVFDIIYTLTKGGPFNSSEVVANRMYMTAFNENNFQYASAMAVVLFIAVLPVLFLNIKNMAYEESVRE